MNIQNTRLKLFYADFQRYLVTFKTPEVNEEFELNFNGKKHKLKRQNFHVAMLKAYIPIKAIQNLWKLIENGIASYIGVTPQALSRIRKRITYLGSVFYLFFP